MSLNEDIRWKQRFSNFDNSFRRLEQSLSIEKPKTRRRYLPKKTMSCEQITEQLIGSDVSIQYQTYLDSLDEERKDNRWTLQAPHPDKTHFEMEEAGKPSRWNTLRALRVLKRF